MSWNNAKKTHQFKKDQERKLSMYRQNGMGDDAIEEITRYDEERFNYDRNFGEHLDMVDLDDEAIAMMIDSEIPYYDELDPFEFGFEDDRLNHIWEHADEKDKKIMHLLAQGYIQSEIGRMMGVTQKAISKRIAKMRRK